MVLQFNFSIYSIWNEWHRQRKSHAYFKIHCQIYHVIISLQPINNDVYNDLEVYFVADYLQQAQTRIDRISNSDQILLTELQNLLHDVNPYMHGLKRAFELVTSLKSNEYNIESHVDWKSNKTMVRGCYNAPTANEVAVVKVNQ